MQQQPNPWGKNSYGILPEAILLFHWLVEIYMKIYIYFFFHKRGVNRTTTNKFSTYPDIHSFTFLERICTSRILLEYLQHWNQVGYFRRVLIQRTMITQNYSSFASHTSIIQVDYSCRWHKTVHNLVCIILFRYPKTYNIYCKSALSVPSVGLSAARAEKSKQSRHDGHVHHRHGEAWKLLGKKGIESFVTDCVTLAHT